MAYQSIDELQALLSQEVFRNRLDCKKAAGRAIGTFIETIAFYLLRQWGENDSIAIERPLAEYGREDITHNVEFTLHPIRAIHQDFAIPNTIPSTARQIARIIQLPNRFSITTNKVISKGYVQNACIIGEDKSPLSSRHQTDSWKLRQ